MNARSCKHLKSLLGDSYEEARIRLKNPDAPPPKGKPASKAKKPASTSKSSASNSKAAQKPASKRKRAVEDDVEEEDAEEDKQPVKKRTRSKPESTASNATTKDAAKVASSKEEDDVKMDDIQEEVKGGDGDDAAEDELASINGVKPKILMADGEEKEVSSLTRLVSSVPSAWVGVLIGG